MRYSTALIIVDIQFDFLLGGALAVPNGGEIIDPIKNLAQKCDLVIATRDWHPLNHSSFKINGGEWPVHCVAGTKGARIHPEIDSLADIVISKGMNIDGEGYSAFENPSLQYILENISARSLDKIYITGLATEYCVLSTVRDAVNWGWTHYLVVPPNAVRGIDPLDEMNALYEMNNMGVKIS